MRKGEGRFDKATLLLIVIKAWGWVLFDDPTSFGFLFDRYLFSHAGLVTSSLAQFPPVSAAATMSATCQYLKNVKKSIE